MSFLPSTQANATGGYAPAATLPTEFDVYPEKLRGDERTETTSSWVTQLFARSPKAIAAKRESILHRHRESHSGRSSAELSISDLESQTSSDANTLLESEEAEDGSVEGSNSSSKLSARVISDAIIGLSDGLTVPFALTAGLSTLGNTRVVIFAGLAELTAGAISMGLGGYLGAKSEEESYNQTLQKTRTLAAQSSTHTANAIRAVFEPYDLPSQLTDDLTLHLAKSPEHLVPFLMAFQHQSPEPEASQAITCALTIAGGYFLGGFVPLVPYFLVGREEVLLALWWSLGVMAVSLFVFGYGKTGFVCGWRGRENILRGCKGGVQMVIVGGLAAGCAMGLVRVFNGFSTD